MCNTVGMSGGSVRVEEIRAQVAQSRERFLRTDFTLCSTFVQLALTRLQIGNRQSAEQAIASAEAGYRTLTHFLSDPKHISHLTANQHREFDAELQKLRKKLDQLQSQLRQR